MENVRHSHLRWSLGFTLLLGLMFGTAGQALALTVYVNDASTTGDVYSLTAGNNANPGTDAMPVATLQYALANFVFTLGDTIYVDAGTYTDQMLNVTSADAGVVIKGAGRALTIFDGINYTSRWMVINGNNVKIMSMTVRRYGHSTGLAGQALTLQDATGMAVLDMIFEDQGNSGGEATIYISTTSTISTTATVTNCVIQNTLGNFGGGIDICSNAGSALPTLNVTLNDVLIENCGKNNFNGGAMLIYKGLSALGTTPAPVVVANNCVFGSPGRGNIARRGGGIYVDNGSTLTMNGACVSNNVAIDVTGPDGGGGIFLIDGTVTLIDGMVTNNSANTGTPKYGGGIFVNKAFTGTSTLNLFQTEISGNTGLDGAGVYLDRSTTTMKNVLIHSNIANDEGGGICLSDANCFLTMHNCTVAANTTTSGSGLDHGGLQNKQCNLATIVNSIFWGNTRADIVGATNLTVRFSIVDPAGPPTFTDGGNNSAADPLFMNAASGDYRLLNGTSPAVNTGSVDGGNAPLGDIVGTTRAALPDMGAYELGATSVFVRDCPNIRQFILPVFVTDFAMTCNDEGSLARWTARIEATSAEFWLEASSDGRNFERISEVIEADARRGEAKFEIPVPASASNSRYFRLASHDADGQSLAYTKIEWHAPCERTNLDLLLYPTIVHDRLQFELASTEDTEYKVAISDIAGRIVHTAHYGLSNRVTDQVDVQFLPAGTYFVRVQAARGDFVVGRFVKE